MSRLRFNQHKASQSMIKYMGGCHCGSVRYELNDAPLFTQICHCDECQKLTGTAFNIGMACLEHDVVFTQGTPKTYSFATKSEHNATLYFCEICNSHLGGRYSIRQGIFALRAGTLDNTTWFKPQAQIWVKYKMPWLTLPADIPHFEKGYIAKEVWPEESLQRWLDYTAK